MKIFKSAYLSHNKPGPNGLVWQLIEAREEWTLIIRLPWWLRRQRICLQCRRSRFYPWVGKIPWSREWLPTSVFLPGEFHGQRSLVSYSPWGCKEPDTTEQLMIIKAQRSQVKWVVPTSQFYIEAEMSCTTFSQSFYIFFFCSPSRSRHVITMLII